MEGMGAVKGIYEVAILIGYEVACSVTAKTSVIKSLSTRIINAQ